MPDKPVAFHLATDLQLLQVLAGDSGIYHVSLHNPHSYALQVDLQCASIDALNNDHSNSIYQTAHPAYQLQLSSSQIVIAAQSTYALQITARSAANASAATHRFSLRATTTPADVHSLTESVSAASNSAALYELPFSLELRENYISALLPAVVNRDASAQQLLSPLINIMHRYQQRIADGRHTLPTHFNPYSCPEHFIPLLVQMLDLDRIFSGNQRISPDPALHRSSCPLGRVRNVIAVAMHCSQWRGTSRGLKLFLQAATGIDDFKIRENPVRDGKPQAFHIAVNAASAALKHRDLIQRIIRNEKPAYVSAELSFPTFGAQHGSGVLAHQLITTLGPAA